MLGEIVVDVGGGYTQVLEEVRGMLGKDRCTSGCRIIWESKMSTSTCGHKGEILTIVR